MSHIQQSLLVPYKSRRGKTSRVGIMVGVIGMSMSYFPFSTVILPEFNTKMLLASIGVAVLLFDLAVKGCVRINRDFVLLVALSMILSFISFASTTLNSTYDTSYSTYFMSMLTWLGAAYFVVRWIGMVHGLVTPNMIILYLTGACALQCLLALGIAIFPLFHTLADTILTSEGFMGKNPGRLYGFGCALDVAGSRFAVVIIMMAFLVPEICRGMMGKSALYSLSFAGILICCIGCIISRTTLVGIILSLPVFVYYLCCRWYGEGNREIRERQSSIIRIFMIVLLLSVGVCTCFYKTNDTCRRQLRFGFEGIFSLVETGRWKVSSNSQLAGQYVFPDKLSSWLIGDGYFVGVQSNPYCVTDDLPSEFYKGTDVGYSRLIFFFGLAGMTAFALFIAVCAKICSKYIPSHSYMFILILIFSFIYWLKVASDMFPAFAPFLAYSLSSTNNVQPVRSFL